MKPVALLLMTSLAGILAASSAQAVQDVQTFTTR